MWVFFLSFRWKTKRTRDRSLARRKNERTIRTVGYAACEQTRVGLGIFAVRSGEREEQSQVGKREIRARTNTLAPIQRCI